MKILPSFWKLLKISENDCWFLAILEKFDFNNISPISTERFHLQAEVSKIAYEQRENNIGDPKFNQFNYKSLIDSEYISSLASKISIDNIYKPKNYSITAHPETIYITVVDKDQNAVSFINSCCYAFGSGLTSKKTGVYFIIEGLIFV